MTDAPYEIVLLAADDRWASRVEHDIRDGLGRILGDPAAVDIVRSLPPERDAASRGPHTVGLFLADERSRDDAALLSAVDRAIDRAIAVLPLVHPGADIFKTLPAALSRLNAVEWTDPPERPVQAALRLLGLIERQRKLFLSYRRNEATPLALQLRRALSERAYDVFLDRFSVPPAADFQERINVELSDKAFVLVLESPSATDSLWVQHEVTFALTHQISLLALLLPDTSTAQRHRVIPDSMRHPLTGDELAGDGALKDEALGRVLDRIEASYAAQLRRRRSGMLDSLRQWLDRAHADPEPTDSCWALAARWPPDRTSIFLITPRAPTPRDLFELDGLRRLRERTADSAVEATLAFGAPVRDADDRGVITWMCDRRPLEVRPHLELKEVLGA